MPVNPFQASAEMTWGGYESKKSYRGQGQMGAGSLSGQGHRSQANNQGYTTGELKPTPQAKGTMPMGKADIGRPDYGRGAPAAPAREGRRAAFGGMGPGAVKGGGSGLTAGGNINFDLSIGKRDFAGADMRGARYAEEGSSAVLGDTKTDNRMYDNRKLEMNAGDGGKGGDATSGDAKATGATPGATPGSSRAARAPRAPRTPEQRQARNTRDRARRAELKASGTTPGAGTTATSGDAKGGAGGAGGGFSGDALAVAERFMSGESSMTNNATTNVGTGNSRDTSKKSSRSSRTDVRASGESVASADTSTTDARRTPAAKEKPAAAPAAKKPDKKATKEKTDETEKRSEIKDKAREDLAEATKKTPTPAAKRPAKGKGSKKKTAGGVTKEEEE